MAEQLISKLKFQEAEYVIKDSYARSELEKRLYSHIYDLSSANALEGIQGDEIVWDAAVNAYKCKGNITINVPHLGTYQVLLSTINSEGAIISAANNNYAVGQNVIFLQEKVDSIAFTANDYIYINLIKVDETIFTIPDRVSLLKNDALYLSGVVEDELLIFNLNFVD